MKKTLILAAAITGALLIQPASAQTHSHSGHGQPKASDSPSTREYKQAHMKMMRDMDIAYTGDADVDFVRGMIPHHQAAIDAAKIVLKYGKNPENQKLAKAIIEAQEREIAEMQAWLKKHAK